MNVIKLNSVGEKREKKAKKSGMRYFDCLKEIILGNEHGMWIVDSNKLVNFDTGDVAIGPEVSIDNGYMVAVAVDSSNRRVYLEGRWVPYKEYLKDVDGFLIEQHIEISEKEFYHIPKHEQVFIKNEKDIQSLFEKFYALFKRYNFEVLELPLRVWAKSLYVDCEGVGDSSSADFFSLHPAVDHAADIARISFGPFYLERLIMHETGDTFYSFNFN